MDRNEAPENTKWKVSDIFATHKDWENAVQTLEKSINEYEKFKGKFSDPQDYLSYKILRDKYWALESKVYSYTYSLCDLDDNNEQAKLDKQRLQNYGAKLSEKTAFIDPELASLPLDYLQNLMQDEELSDYKHSIDSFIRSRKYILSDKEEQALSIMDKFSDGFETIFDTLTEKNLQFKPIKINGKEIPLDKNNYHDFIEGKDAQKRKQAYENHYEAYKNMNDTLAYNYIYFVKMCCSDLSLRGKGSFLDSSFYMKNMPTEVYSNLIEQINKNVNLEQKYFQLLKNKLNISDFGFKDVYQSLATTVDDKFDLNTQKEIILKALSPMGTKYQALINHAYNNNWLDVYPNKHKSTGGYMRGTYGVHPFIFLNNNDSFDSMSTMAHELGHAMHTVFSQKNQPISTSRYATFIAEIASTVNEILLSKYMIKNVKNNEEKLFYLDKYIQDFKSTVFRQTMFSEFEDFAFKTIEKDGILSPEILNNKYKSLLTKNFGEVVPVDDKIICEWSRIPHFYSPYYVFQYATSYISACYIANKILEGDDKMKEGYMQLLSSGGKDYPTELLKQTVGIDLTKNDVYDYAFNTMRESLKEVEQIMQKEEINAL